MNVMKKLDWQKVCDISDLVAGSGVCALLGNEHVALFYLPEEQPQVFALNDFDPIGKASVLSRGIVGDVDGEIVVASPLYKQHFSLSTGKCLEDEEVAVAIYEAKLEGKGVLIRV